MATSTQPTKLLMRRKDVLAWLSVSARDLQKWVENGIVHPIQLPGQYAFYNRDEIRRKILDQAP